VGRRLGQHFLARQSILNRIAAAACDEDDPVAIEIGAGKGALTECLLSRARKVVAIEIDPTICAGNFAMLWMPAVWWCRKPTY